MKVGIELPSLLNILHTSVFSEWIWKDHTIKISSSTSWEQHGPYQPQDRPPGPHPPLQRNDANTGKCVFFYIYNQNKKAFIMSNILKNVT